MQHRVVAVWVDYCVFFVV